MFQLVEVENLCPDQKYKIIAGDVYTGIYKGECWHNHHLLIFDEVRGSIAYFSKNRQFYQFISQKVRIQSDMEQRALNLILYRLLGDYFKW
jgi:hypothetical protein